MISTLDNHAVLILGASTRAAAFSALRAGLNPVCADLFADLDLAQCFPVTRVPVSEYPSGLERAASQAPPGPWLYVGAIENHPELVGRIAAQRPLWGNGPDLLRSVRDPFRVNSCLARAGLPQPAVHRPGDPMELGRDWLIKPLDGAGGRGIREVPSEGSGFRVQRSEIMADHSPLTTHHAPLTYFQERIDGLPCAAVFVGNGRHARLLGVTRQLVGEPAFHAKPYHYCGSIGPLMADRTTQANCVAVGEALVREFGLLGLFGVDGVLRDEAFWPVEVNPRYTASVEILEHALSLPLLAVHRDACVEHRLPDERLVEQAHNRSWQRDFLGKAILYAANNVVAPELSHRLGETIDWPGRWPVPGIADVPQPGSVIAANRPILTVFACGQSLSECQSKLVEEAKRPLVGRK